MKLRPVPVEGRRKHDGAHSPSTIWVASYGAFCECDVAAPDHGISARSNQPAGSPKAQSNRLFRICSKTAITD